MEHNLPHDVAHAVNKRTFLEFVRIEVWFMQASSRVYTAMYSLLDKRLGYPAAAGLVMFISSLLHQSSGEAYNMLAVHKYKITTCCMTK